VKITIDTDAKEVRVQTAQGEERHDIFSAAAFDAVSREWMRIGWQLKYSYGFTWMGRPLIQFPEDVIRIQETIYRVKPDVIVETGVAHGGSLIFYAGLLTAMGKGRVVGVDIEIRPHNRKAIEAHEMASKITLIEGSSTDADVIRKVKEQIRPGERVLVILDSNHTKKHVADELQLYSPLVSSGSYIVATDGIMEDLSDVPNGRPTWTDDNPASAAREFAAAHPEFELETLPFLFAESEVKTQLTYWPSAYLRRR
jgi:cephalosporin hydroxylase